MMPIYYYLAGRSEDVHIIDKIRAAIDADPNFLCVSKWIDQVKVHGNIHPDPVFMAQQARNNFHDLGRASVFLLYKPIETHRLPTTGGHHVEFGMALRTRVKIIVLGTPENCFHYDDYLVSHVAPDIDVETLRTLMRMKSWQSSSLDASAK